MNQGTLINISGNLEEYTAAAGTTTYLLDSSAAYDECIQELDTALNGTKSKKLQELISNCIERLKVLKQFADQQEATIKQLQEATPVQQYIATSDGQYILASTGTAFHGQAIVQEQTNSFTIPASASPQHKPSPGSTKTRGVSANVATQTDHRITGTVFHTTEVLSISKASRAPPKNTTKIRSNKLKTDEEPPKEYFVSEAMNHAFYEHDFGKILERYDKKQIMSMAESGARESVKNFVVHGLLEPFSVPSSDRLSYTCLEPECHRRVFNNYLSALYHCLRLHLNGFRPYRCPECDKRFYSRTQLRKHNSRHTGIYLYNCSHEGCNFKTNSKPYLEDHLNSHEGIHSYKCEYAGCGAEFSSRNAFRTHLEANHLQRKYPCNFEGCDKEFTTMKQLYLHRRMHRPKARTHKCKFCDYAAHERRSLLRHMKCIHQYPAPMTQEERLKLNKYQYEKTKCPHCDRELKRASLRSHIQTHHTPKEDLPYPKQCLTCRQFYNLDQRSYHNSGKCWADKLKKAGIPFETPQQIRERIRAQVAATGSAIPTSSSMNFDTSND